MLTPNTLSYSSCLSSYSSLLVVFSFGVESHPEARRVVRNPEQAVLQAVGAAIHADRRGRDALGRDHVPEAGGELRRVMRLQRLPPGVRRGANADLDQHRHEPPPAGKSQAGD